MLKGCQRRIIMVKDTGSKYFDSAYFVIKHDLPKGSRESDMLAEAHRMIDACEVKEPSTLKTVPNVTATPITRKKISSALARIMLFLAGVSVATTVLLVLN